MYMYKKILLYVNVSIHMLIYTGLLLCINAWMYVCMKVGLLAYTLHRNIYSSININAKGMCYTSKDA